MTRVIEHLQAVAEASLDTLAPEVVAVEDEVIDREEVLARYAVGETTFTESAMVHSLVATSPEVVTALHGLSHTAQTLSQPGAFRGALRVKEALQRRRATPTIVATPQSGATAIPPVPRLFETVKAAFPLRQWLSELIRTTQVLPARTAYAFADAPELPTKLSFDDERARGSYVLRSEDCCLHIEHLDWAPGTLIYLGFWRPEDAPTAEETEVASYFAVLHEGFRPYTKLQIPLREVAGTRVCIAIVDTIALPEEAASDLQRSLGAARRAVQDDPTEAEATEEAWQVLATTQLSNNVARPTSSALYTFWATLVAAR